MSDDAKVIYVFLTKRQRHVVGAAVGLGDALKVAARQGEHDTTVRTVSPATNKAFDRMLTVHEFRMNNDAVYNQAHYAVHFMD